MDTVYDNILNLLISFLGDYGKSSGEWYSFDCPCCAEEKMVDGDGKYNLEVTINPDEAGCGGFHCWRCGEYSGMKGSLTKLFKRYANEDIISEYRRLVKDYRESRRYELSFDGPVDEIEADSELFLPDGFKPLDASDPKGIEAYNYVKGRGLNDHIIRRFRIGYIGGDARDRSLRNRVYFPSYDEYGSLNYWTGRDYTGKNKQKSKNPKTSKNDIVFNEALVNWYEPITIVEGPFDHVVTPNSIPLLGKTLDTDSAVYRALVERSRSIVRIFLDDDAAVEAEKMYRLLSSTRLRGSVRIIDGTHGHDASDIYQSRGAVGIIETLCSARESTEYNFPIKF